MYAANVVWVVCALLALSAGFVRAWNDGIGDISSGYFSVFIDTWRNDYTLVTEIHTENNPKARKENDCGKSWYTLTSSLPWTVDVHPGNVCSRLPQNNHDNLWIKYANQFLNTPTDTRCGPISNFRVRCIIAVHP